MMVRMIRSFNQKAKIMQNLAEVQNVCGVIESYMACWIEKDLDTFKKLFHEKFVMVAQTRKGIIFSSADFMFPKVEDNDATWNKYSARITHVEVAGAIATVSLEEYGVLDIESPATSFFQLAKDGDNWLICTKTYQFRS